MSDVRVSVGADIEENPVIVVMVGEVAVTCQITKGMITAHYISASRKPSKGVDIAVGGDKEVFNSGLTRQLDKYYIERIASDLCLCGGFLSTTAAAFRMNCNALNVELMVEREILIGVNTDAGYQLPEFQFKTEGVNASCFPINSELRGCTALEKIHFYVMDREDLGGRTPIQMMGGVNDTHRLMVAARAYREEVKCCEK